MKTLILFVLTLTATSLFSQNDVTWVGGTPGKETAWEEARNWSNSRVPNEFSDVFIPDVSTTTFSYPVISNGTIEVNALTVVPGAQLTVEQDVQMIIYENATGLTAENVILSGVIVLIDEKGEEVNLAVNK